MFPTIGVPQNGWFVTPNHIKMDDWGVLDFWKHPYSDTQYSIATSLSGESAYCWGFFENTAIGVSFRRKLTNQFLGIWSLSRWKSCLKWLTSLDIQYSPRGSQAWLKKGLAEEGFKMIVIVKWMIRRRKLTKLCSLLLWYRSIYLDFCLLHVEKRLWWHVDTNWFIGYQLDKGCWRRFLLGVCKLFAKEETLIYIFIRSSHAWMWCDEPHKVFCIICLHVFTWDMRVILAILRLVNCSNLCCKEGTIGDT